MTRERKLITEIKRERKLIAARTRKIKQKQRGKMKAKGNKEPDLHIARNKSVQNSNHGHVGLRKKLNLNVKYDLT